MRPDTDRPACRSDNPAVFHNLREELRIALTRFFDIMYPVGMVFGGIALVASLIGSRHYGWYPVLVLHIGLYLVAIAILLLRRRLPALWMFFAMAGLVSVTVVHSLVMMGLASKGMLSLTVLCTFAGVFLGIKAGIIAVGIGALTASLIGAGICTGVIATRPDVAAYISTPTVWVVQIASFLMYVIPLILAVNSMHLRMARSLQDMKDMNERLHSEISMRTAAENELRRSEAQYRAIFEHAKEGIFQVTPSGTIKSVNPSMARMGGYESPRELIESDYHDEGRRFWVEPENRAQMRKALEEQGCMEGFETQFHRRDGATVWVSINAHTVRDENGEIAYFEGSVEDITKRKLAEIALHESEMKYRSVVESSLVASYVVQDDLFRFVNTRFCTLFGYSYEEIVDTLSPLNLVHPDELERMRLNLRRQLEGETIDNEHEIKAVRKDGKVITVKFLGGYFTYNGRPAAFGTLIDITKEVTLESQLRQSQKMEAIGTLAGGIAHDFNNILTALTGYGTLLQMKLGEGNPLKLYADQILSASHKAASLTQSLLAFSRRQPITLNPQDVNTVVRDTRNLLTRLLTEDITLVTHLGDEDMVVMADSTQIDQILFNLVGNARDAMPGGGTITITTKKVELDREFMLVHGFGETGQYALITVADTGIGMDEETKEKIFDPFFTTKDVGKGTGLGLSTVYGIVKQHGGYITVHTGIGRGCVFHIYFPAVKTAAEKKRISPSFLTRGKEKILVAEDNEHVRVLLTDILAQYGYEVVVAVDGHDAVRKFEESEGISLVVMDSVMPKKNGREAYDDIQKLRPGVPTLFMSGYTTDVVLDKGVEEGQFDFIPKPLSPHELLHKVRRILDRPGPMEG